jgi:hypothetical protein
MSVSHVFSPLNHSVLTLLKQVSSIYYMTVGLEPLLLKKATPENPGRVINIASMAGITTVDVTSGEGGGLAAPGTSDPRPPPPQPIPRCLC